MELDICLIYARALLEYVFFILRVCSVSKMLPSMKFAEIRCSFSRVRHSP